jgi:hypothetical protein
MSNFTVYRGAAAEPKTHRKHMRRTRFARIRRSRQLQSFIRQQATRLSVADSEVADRLENSRADEIRAENS